MELRKNILEMVCGQSACTSGIDRLMKADSQRKLINLYFRHIDFCLARKVPSNDFIKANFDNKTLTSKGVYLSYTGTVENPERTAIIGQSEMTLNFDGYSVGRVYMADNSVATINAGGNAFVVVDCVDSSKLTVSASENAKVIVNAYSDAEVSGNTANIHRNTAKTYLLQ